MAALTAEVKGKISEIHISNQDAFLNTLENIRAGGWDNLQVIADFDRTLTKFEVNGQPGASCHGIIESLPCLSTAYKKLASQLYEKFYPIEHDHTMTESEKLPYMLQWYRESHEALLKENITRRHIEEAVRQSNVTLRPGAKELADILHEKDVPFLIFSAGIADVIHEVFKQKLGVNLGESVLDTTHVISNWMKFKTEKTDAGSEEVLCGFSEPLIHMYNKNESQTKGHSYAKQVEERGNVILLGDGVGDVDMCRGIPHDNVLKVGFLNANVENLLPKYKSIYDVVVTHDGGMDFLLKVILKDIV